MSMSHYESLYRKYRPSSFAEMRGQEHVVSVLEAAIMHHQVGHAYLFSGGRGIGKTSLARIFARTLDIAPVDQYEIDGASKTKVEDMRELIESVSTLPFQSSRKMYIIDEVHMLSKSSFNALLKTLEEPPAHVIFVLATTELHKVPDTIISRCQSFVLHRPDTLLLSAMVQDVVHREGKKIEEEAADIIALLGDGSYRDTHGVLEKVLIAQYDAPVLTLQATLATCGAPSQTLILDFLKALADRDLSKLLELIHDLRVQHVSEETSFLLLVYFARLILEARFTARGRDYLQKHPAHASVLEAIITGGVGLNSEALLMLLDAHAHARLSPLAYVSLEIGCARICGQ